MFPFSSRDTVRGIALATLLILSVFAGIPIGTTAASTQGSISVTDYTLHESQGYEKEPLNASVTVNNTKSGQDTKHVVVEYYDEYNGHWKTVGSKDVTVSGGSERTVNVTYFINSTPQGGDATIHVNTLSNSTVSIQDTPTYIQDITPESTSVTVGDSVTTSVTVRNYGSETVERRVTLRWDASGFSSKVIELGPDSEQTIEFTPTLNIAGIQSIRSGGTSGEPVRVTNSSVDVTVSGPTLQTNTVYTREDIIANATVTNNGESSTGYAVTLTTDPSQGQTKYTTSVVSLASGESRNVSFGNDADRPGEYKVALQGQLLPNATVKRPFNATKLTVQNGTVVAGQPTTISVDVKNRKASQIWTDITLQENQSGYWRDVTQQDFTLNASEHKQLTFNVTFDSAGTFSIRAANSGQTQIDVFSEVNVSNVSMPASPVYSKEPIAFNATVTNRLSQSTTATVLLEEQTQYGYYELTSKDVQLAANESKRISIPYVFDSAGSKTVRIGGDKTRTIDIKDTPVTVGGVAVSGRNLEAGNSTTVTATLYNWQQTGTAYQATLKIDGTEHETNSRQISRTVYVPADSKETVTFTPTFTMGGAHSIEVGHEDGGIVSVADSNVSVVSRSVVPDVVYKRDVTPVSVTLNNTANTTQQFAVTAIADKNTSQWHTESNTTVFSINTNSKATKEITVSPSSVGNYTITVNSQVVDMLKVKRGVKVDSTDISDHIVTVGETLYFNQTLRNPTSEDRTYYASVDGQSYRSDIPSGTTMNVSRQLSFQSTGVKRIWADGRSYKVFVIADTTGNANITFDRTYTPSKVVNGSTEGVFAKVKNTGDATTVRNVSLSINGSTVAKERVYVPANSTQNVYLEHTFTSFGDYTGKLNLSGGPMKTFNGTVRSKVVVEGSESITHIAGTQPGSMPAVDAKYSGGSVYLKVTQNGRFVRNLSALGADSTTRFNISFLVENYKPRVVVGSGRNIDLTVTDTDQAGQKRVTIKLKPSQLDYKYDFQGDSPSSPAEWNDKVKNNTADYGWETAVHLRVGNAKTAIDAVNASVLSGMTVSTDAQLFTMPRYIPNTSDTQPHIEVSLAAPHKTVNGNINNGYYVAFLPDTLLSEWNVTSPSEQLDATYQDQNLTMDVTETANGAIVDISLHYSSGTLQISKTMNRDQGSSGDTGSGDDSSDSTDGSDGSNTAPSDDDGSDDSTGSNQDNTDTTTSTTTKAPTTTTTTPEPTTTTIQDSSTTTSDSTTTSTDSTSTTKTGTTTTLESGESTSTQDPEDSSSGASTPGFGILAAIIAAGALLAFRAT